MENQGKTLLIVSNGGFILENPACTIFVQPQNLCWSRSPHCSKRDPRSQPPITLHHSLALRPFVRRRQMVVRFFLTDGFAHKSGLSRKQQLFFPPRHTGGHCPVVKPALRMVRRRPNHSHTHLLSYATKPNLSYTQTNEDQKDPKL